MSLANFNSLTNLYSQKLGKLEAVTNTLQSTEQRIKTLEENELTISQASIFLQSLSDTTRIQVIERISKLVTELLQTVKDPNLEFRMNLGVERSQADLKFFVVDKLSGKEFDALESMGGGVVDLIALGLRVSLLVLWKPKLARILILDETLKYVSVSDQELASEFIRKLSEQLGLQIIFISHSKTLAEKSHASFLIEKINGISQVRENTNA